MQENEIQSAHVSSNVYLLNILLRYLTHLKIYFLIFKFAFLNVLIMFHKLLNQHMLVKTCLDHGVYETCLNKLYNISTLTDELGVIISSFKIMEFKLNS